MGFFVVAVMVMAFIGLVWWALSAFFSNINDNEWAIRIRIVNKDE